MKLFEIKTSPVHVGYEISPRGAHFLGAIECSIGWVDLYNRKMPSRQVCYHAQIEDKLVTITDLQFQKMRALPLNQIAVLLWLCWRRNQERKRDEQS